MTMIPKQDITTQHAKVNELRTSGLKYKTALSDSSIRWGGWRFGGNMLVMLVLVLLILPVVGSAETEVEGEVSGEWIAEDSPYIVVDSTWVPEGEQLRIGPGVDVMFGEGIGFDVFGLLTADGNEEDSVRFLPGEDEENWRGFLIHDTEASVDLTYCAMREAENAFLCGTGADIILNNCNIRSLHKPFGELQPDGDLVSVEMDNCRIEGGEELIFGYLSQLIGSNSIIRSGTGENWGIKISGFLSLDNCVIYGSCQVDLGSEYVNCDFLKVNDSLNCRVEASRSMTDCYVQGNVYLGPRQEGVLLFTNNEIEGYIRGGSFSGRLINNLVEGEVDLDHADVTIEDCEINGNLEGFSINVRLISNIIGGNICFFVGDVFMQDCIIYGTYGHASASTISIIECQIFNNNFSLGSGVSCNSREPNGEVIIEKSFIAGALSISNMGEISILNNTVIVDNLYYCMLTIGGNQDVFDIRNNIFYCLDDDARLLDLPIDCDLENINFEYNCIWYFEYLLDHYSIEHGIEFELDETNVVDDPIILSPFEPYLKWGSPCIDAGDPESPLDPDSTRADIGAFYFDCQTVFKDSGEIHPTGFTTYPAYPNPFNASVSVRFQTAKSSRIQANIFDLNGRKIFTLPVDYYLPGSHVITWETHSLNVPSGEYLFQINGEKTSKVAKVVLIR